MNDYNAQLSALLKDFGKGKSMVLSTSKNDQVTSRTMSIVQKDGIFYFQTDKLFRKYDQLINNSCVALCKDDLEVEGICKELGHPLDHSFFVQLYKECFPASFEKYSALQNERLFSVRPFYIQRWLYKENKPFIEIFDLRKQEYSFKEYLMT